MKKANPLAIGIFVVGAAMLALFAIIVFGAGRYFVKTDKYICYFSETVNGLDIGAPVKYKGVRIGKVDNILISSASDAKKARIIVTFSVLSSEEVAKMAEIKHGKILNVSESLSSAIQDGLRAKLAYQSVVTGMLYVELDYFAKRGDNINYYYDGSEYKEMPSVQSSGIAEFSQKFSLIADDIVNMNLDQIGANLNSMLIKLNTKLDEIDAKTLNANANALLSDADKMVLNANSLIGDPSIRNSLKDLSETIKNINTFIVQANASLTEFTKDGKQTFESANTLMATLNGFLAPNSPFRFELSNLLINMGRASSSAAELLDYIERNPNSIITGKGSKKNK